MVAKYNGNQDKISVPLNVISCDSAGLGIKAKTDKSRYTSIGLPENFYILKEGKSKSIPVKVSNNLPVTQLYTISFRNIEDFAEEGTSKAITLAPFQSTTVFLDLLVSKRAEVGVYSPIIEISDGEDVLSTESVTIQIKGTTQVQLQESGFLSNIPLFAWIIMDFAVVLVLILGVIVVTKLR